MNRRQFLKAVPAFAVLAAKGFGFAQDAAAPSGPAKGLQPIKLPKPEKDGGKSVLAALQERRTIRRISEKKLPPRMLSNLLWAAWGVNRKVGPFRQAVMAAKLIRCMEYMVENKGKLDIKVHPVPIELDNEVARLKLMAMGVAIDTLTAEQQKYLASWEEGT